MNPVLVLALNLVGLALVYLLVRRSVFRSIERGILRERLSRDVGELVATINRSADEAVTVLEDRIGAARALSRRLEAVARYMEQLPAPPDPASGAGTAAPQSDARSGPEDGSGSATKTDQTGPESHPGAREPEHGAGDLRAKVLSMHGEGIATETIADRLGVPVGQVELIVALGAFGAQQ